MEYLYAAAWEVIATFIATIFAKKPKQRADYLLIGINVLVALFLLGDVLVARDLSSASIIFQSTVPLKINVSVGYSWGW